MAKRRSISEARSTLPRLIREAEGGESVELTRRGETVAVLLGRQQYERLTGMTRRFSQALDEFTQNVDVAALNLDPDEIFGGVRDEDTGRDCRL